MDRHREDFAPAIRFESRMDFALLPVQFPLGADFGPQKRGHAPPRFRDDEVVLHEIARHIEIEPTFRPIVAEEARGAPPADSAPGAAGEAGETVAPGQAPVFFDQASTSPGAAQRATKFTASS